MILVKLKSFVHIRTIKENHKFRKNLTPEFFNVISVETFLKLYKLNMKKYAIISNKKRNELI